MNKRFAMKKVSKHRMVMKKQVQQVYYERDILSFAENPFVVGLWCTFQTKVCKDDLCLALSLCDVVLVVYFDLFLSYTVGSQLSKHVGT